MWVWFYLLSLIPEPRAPENFWPTSWIGWLTSISITITVGTFVYNKITGRAITMKGIAGSLADLAKESVAINTRLNGLEQVIEEDHELLREIDWEVRGPKGENGIKSKVVECLVRIEKIDQRNREKDLLIERFKQIIRNYNGPERRGEFRDMKDWLDEDDRR